MLLPGSKPRPTCPSFADLVILSCAAVAVYQTLATFPLPIGVYMICLEVIGLLVQRQHKKGFYENPKVLYIPSGRYTTTMLLICIGSGWLCDFQRNTFWRTPYWHSYFGFDKASEFDPLILSAAVQCIIAEAVLFVAEIIRFGTIRKRLWELEEWESEQYRDWKALEENSGIKSIFCGP